ncbi:MAG: DUF1287 domain-containing protein [Marinicaulis sp.]|nr:DUF1287 domain-containing protein [Marinicaulis sp.]
MRKKLFVSIQFVMIAALPVLFGAQGAGAQTDDFGMRLSQAAIERTHHRVIYDASYVRLEYPGGDVAADKGVCADVVVRALRTLDIDLQKLVHEDMVAAFSSYPQHWALSRPDRNIDHRRVPNLETFFTRKGVAQSISTDPADYLPGDIVAWNLRGAEGGWLPHIGIVTDRMGSSGVSLVVHNIGAGPQLEGVLFDWKITGHYRYRGED